MNQEQIEQAARTLWTAWQDGRRMDGLPVDCRPATIEQGYAIQAAMVDVAGETVVGWKIAATSVGGQQHIGVDGPLAGRLFAGKVVEAPASVPLGQNAMRLVELEFAFRMSEDLPPRDRPYTQDEVMARVGNLYTAVEIPDSRYTQVVGAGAAQLIADNACAYSFVLGEAAPPDWRDLDLAAHPVRLKLNGAVAIEGVGGNVLGDPRLALTWLANDFAARGEGLRAGEIVTTGTCVTPTAIQPGDQIHGDFGSLGSIEVACTD